MYDDLIIWESWGRGEEFINQFSSVGGEEGPEFANDDEERDDNDNCNENVQTMTMKTDMITHLIHE